MNDANHITSPARSTETVGNSSKVTQTTERVRNIGKDADFALGFMWAAFQSQVSPNVANFTKPLTNPQISLYGSYYETLIPNTESGEGVVSSSDTVQVVDYYPYGDERINEDYGHDETRKFVGMERDDETGLDYAKARYYESARGQFLSQDPSFLDIGAGGFEAKYERTLQQHLANPQALNSYSWALNNPINQKDPEGEIVPLLIAAYAAFEIGLSAYDAYSTAATLADPSASGGEKAFSAGGFVAGLALPGAGYGTAANKAAQLAKNAEQGKAFENVVGKLFGKDNAITAKQVTIQAKDGTKTRVDFIGRDACGNCSIIEAKSSQTAPLTKNQQTAFPQIGQSGGTVVGAGKPGFPGGIQIPPTKVNVVRP